MSEETELPETVEELIEGEVALLRAADEEVERMNRMVKQRDWLDKRIDTVRERYLSRGFTYPAVCRDIRDEVWRRYQKEGGGCDE